MRLFYAFVCIYFHYLNYAEEINDIADIRGLVAKVLDGDIVGNEFKLQSR